MTPEQRQALTESLAHWEENVIRVSTGERPFIGALHCPCCILWISKGCKGCPIPEITGRLGCRGTVYDDVIDMLHKHNALIEACKLERDWLKLILDSEVDDES